MTLDGAVTALAAVSRTPGAAPELEEVWMQPARGGEVLVDIEAVGLCHADVAANAGDFPVGFPIVLGHEGCGVVRSVGPLVQTLAPGDRVVLSYQHCGACGPCTNGQPTRCVDYMALNFPHDPPVLGRGPDGVVHGGFFGQSSLSTIARVTERNAILVATDLPAEWLAPLGCGVQTGAGAVVNVGRPAPSDVIVVVGLGAVGLSAVMTARARGLTSIVAVDLDADRRALAEELGASATIDAGDPDWGAALPGIAGGTADLVIECSGSARALAPALAALRPGGRAVLVGAPPFGTTSPLDIAAVVNKSLRIQGTVEGDSLASLMIPWLVHAIEAGRLPVDRIISEYAFTDLNLALDGMGCGPVIKPVLTMPHQAQPTTPIATQQGEIS